MRTLSESAEIYAGEVAERATADASLSIAPDVHRQWLAAMQRGDFEAAWQQTDRLEIPRRENRLFDPEYHLLWDGTPFDGRRVLIRCNHGLGDTIQFARFVPAVSRRAPSVTMLVQPPLVDLLSGMLGRTTVQNGWTEEVEPKHDVVAEVMELAYALRVTADQIPRCPYLDAKKIRARSALRIRPEHRSREPYVGLIWASSKWDGSRSVPTCDLAPLREIAARYLSLQQGPEAEDAASLAFPVESISHLTRDVMDAAAAILELDLLITVDTMAAHLAGALGIPVAMLLRHDADWRWGRAGCATPWYPSTRLFRQRVPGHWQSAIADLTQWLSVRGWVDLKEARASSPADKHDSSQF